MKRTDFTFDLPDDLIAQKPVAQRTASRLLVLDKSSGEIIDQQFSSIVDLLQPGDLLVMNDTRVIRARLFGQKQTGGKVEILIERLIDEHNALAQMKSSKSPKVGATIKFDQHFSAVVTGRKDGFFELKFNTSIDQVMEAIGHIPLPPYINREDSEFDDERYQTVFAKQAGAVAAPTAGLHFDQNLLDQLEKKGIQFAQVTLHVGAGTFQPMRVNDINDHKMHSERIEVSQTVCDQIKKTREQGGRVIALGTTTVRALESASINGTIESYSGETSIFIYPGYEFKSVDAMITNFHLPESTLLMLVCAFAGQEKMINAYQHAVDQKYRFFSYGDAMFVY
ncbi:MAG: tRNA preQ1(34) S-adenosylmethionine ribosyltransferase-isomerase QueA [Gammaproteobacteria bacterium]